MSAQNDVFEVVLDNDRLSIDMGEESGSLIVVKDEAREELMLSSPVSGVRDYVFCPQTERWVGKEDAEDMEGMITRDLLRLCGGSPSF